VCVTGSQGTGAAFPAERFQSPGFSITELSGITETAPLGQCPLSLWRNTQLCYLASAGATQPPEQGPGTQKTLEEVQL